MKRAASNLIIFAFLGLVSIDAFPSTSIAHTRMKNACDDILDVSGLWQSWSLFAPKPDSLNAHLSAKINYADGTTDHWKSPIGSELSLREKLVFFRHLEYYDALRQEKNKAAWPGFSDYLKRSYEQTTAKKVQSVELTRHWFKIPAPTANADLLPLSGQTHGFKSRRFFVWPHS